MMKKKNKYQEALNLLDWNCIIEHQKEQDLIQELVDKETPIKPIFRGDSTISFCGKCKTSITHYVGSLIEDNFKYCKSCGKKIDWSDEE